MHRNSCATRQETNDYVKTPGENNDILMMINCSYLSNIHVKQCTKLYNSYYRLKKKKKVIIIIMVPNLTREHVHTQLLFICDKNYYIPIIHCG